MTVEEVNPKVYNNIISNPYQIFGSAQFNQLNEEKADAVYYLLFRDTKYRGGLIGGVRDSLFLSPFSAPFGGFVPIDPNIGVQHIETILDVFFIWAIEKRIRQVTFTLPPLIYSETFISKLINIFFRKDVKPDKIEINHHFPVESFDENYGNSLWQSSRRNLRISLSSGLTFAQCVHVGEMAIVYEVIKKNREGRGFPLRMTFEQVYATSKIIPADFFVVRDSSDTEIAAAIVFKVAANIAQVVFWGDIPGVTHLKSMNFLSYNIFSFYKEKKVKVIDIGISTEDSVPNYGLCEFKESIGCLATPKFTFSRQF